MKSSIIALILFVFSSPLFANDQISDPEIISLTVVETYFKSFEAQAIMADLEQTIDRTLVTRDIEAVSKHLTVIENKMVEASRIFPDFANQYVYLSLASTNAAMAKAKLMMMERKLSRSGVLSSDAENCFSMLNSELSLIVENIVLAFDAQ